MMPSLCRKSSVISFAHAIPDLEVLVDQFGSAAGAGTPVEVRLYGKDIDEVFAVSDGLKEELRKIHKTTYPRIKKALEATGVHLYKTAKKDLVISQKDAKSYKKSTVGNLVSK